MARMTLHFEKCKAFNASNRELEDYFVSIDMLAGSYIQVWSGYKNKMLDDLEDLTALVDAEISGYRFNLN